VISFREAKAIAAAHHTRLQPVWKELDEAAGLVLAETVTAPFDIPAFDQSAMDGYAFCFQQWHPQSELAVEGLLPAGYPGEAAVLPGQAARIFTGAAMPRGADTVVIQEHTRVQDKRLRIEDTRLQTGSNVRPKGSEIRAGMVAMEAGSLLSPGATGFLAGIGIGRVKVYPAPRAGILITGDELQPPGSRPLYGQVYESNSFALKAALRQYGIGTPQVFHVQDKPAALEQAIREALEHTDILLVSGGMSKGDYDFVAASLLLNNVQPLFHGVKQKPAKPMYLGKRGNKLVFGLPGNPSAALTCFYMYVLPAIQYAMGHAQVGLAEIPAVLTQPLQKKKGQTCLLKGYYRHGRVTALPAQESYRMQGFALANCLICLEEEKEVYAAGEQAQVALLAAHLQAIMY
jgi:molybdopterin molybdotransferase